MHPCPRNWVAIGRVVVYYALAAHAFGAKAFLLPQSIYTTSKMVVKKFHFLSSKDDWGGKGFLFALFTLGPS